MIDTSLCFSLPRSVFSEHSLTKQHLELPFPAVQMKALKCYAINSLKSWLTVAKVINSPEIINVSFRLCCLGTGQKGVSLHHKMTPENIYFMLNLNIDSTTRENRKNKKRIQKINPCHRTACVRPNCLLVASRSVLECWPSL
jgi:hypothetical protein